VHNGNGSYNQSVSDTALFHLSVHVDPQNNRYESEENPLLVHKVPIDDVKAGVWCGMSARRITGPIFFPEVIIHIYMFTMK